MGTSAVFKMIIGIKLYFIEIAKLILSKHNCFNIKDLAIYVPEWLVSLENGKNPLSDKRPWISFAATRFLENKINSDMKIFEYGSGGSTLFFATKVKEVISIEHNRSWFEIVVNELKINGIINCTIRLFEPEIENLCINKCISDPDAYLSDDETYRGMSFKKYASSIDLYPDDYFDIVFIDGRARPSCFIHSQKKIKIGGYIVLDNSETPYYYYIHDTLNNNNWKKYEYFGLFPYMTHFSETCVWHRLK